MKWFRRLAKPQAEMVSKLELDVAKNHSDRVARDLNGMISRLTEEYQKHRPVFHDEQSRGYPWNWVLGNGGVTSERASCAAPNCAHFWPCPTWHTLRRIYSERNDGVQYELKMVKVEKKEPNT